MKPAITVIILNWRGAADTIECLESVIGLSWPFCRILICDNESGDGSVAQFNEWSKGRLLLLNEVRRSTGLPAYKYSRAQGVELKSSYEAEIIVIETGANRGYAGGNNVGIRYTLDRPPCDYIWILNNDTVVQKEALTELVKRTAADPKIGLCGSMVLYADRPNLVQCYGGGRFSKWSGRSIHFGWRASITDPVDANEIERKLTYVNGASVFVSRPFLESIGLMDESYFLYYEEPDWGEKARGFFKLGFAASSIVYHKVGRSIGTDDFGLRSKTSEYYLRRNRILFCRRFAARGIPFSLLDATRDAFKALMRGHWARAKLILTSTAWGFLIESRYFHKWRPKRV